MKDAPFYVGQKVVCVDPIAWDDMKRGDEFLVRDIIVHPCGCCGVDIGKCGGAVCVCRASDSNGRMRSAKCFRPIEENTYENISKSLSVLPQDEVPDVKEIKELV